MPVERAGKLLDCRLLLAAALVCACALAAPAVASAERLQFSINTTADEADASPSDETCLTAAGKCSLRAAIEETNSNPVGAPTESDEVRFEEEVFEGDADSVVELTSPLPKIVAPLTLTGRECATEAGVVGPCAEISGDPAAPALAVERADEVTIELVAVTGADVGIELVDAEAFWVKSNWIGTSLEGGPAGNDTGILIGPGSDRSRVGGEGPGAGNLIANSSGAGLEIRGASNVRVLGNRLGVTPTGTDAAANGSNVAIGSAAGSVALENTIGTRLSPEATASPACDGGCNLISGSAGVGIDLSGSGGDAPPVGTTIAGNLVGFDASGEGAIANDEAGAYVGAAPQTTVGGPKPGDANRFAGGTVAIESGPAPGLAIWGNLIGFRAGSSLLPPSAGGILVDSTGLQFPAQEASILDNEIGLEGGTGISQQGYSATISGNRVEGAETGIRVKEEAGGSLLEMNVVVDAEGSGLLLESGDNEVFGNQVGTAGGAGIRLAGAAPFGINANLIGGNTAATENVIDGSGGPAIEIESVEKSWNEVARNRGTGNAGRFIELLPAVPEPGDPNDGIQPPPIASISATAAAGFAEPGAVVRVFRKASTSPGEVESFLGETVADGVGNWALAFPAPLPAGTGVAATQTLNGGTSELEVAAVPLADGLPLAPPGSDGADDGKPPRTRMLKQPRRVRSGHVARFSFTANEPGSSFQCSLDRGEFRPCRSPKKYRLSRPGKHLFRVRAVDPAGNVDPTPVRRRFEVLD